MALETPGKDGGMPGADDRIANLRKVLAVTSKINSTLNLDELLTVIMTTATEVMSTEVASLLLMEEASQELVFRVALGDKGSNLTEKFRVKVGEGIAGSVAQKGESVIVQDARNDPRFARRFDDNTGFVTKGMLCVPMKAKGKVIGVLQAINPRGDKKIGPGDLELFEIFADQAAIAVENAKLHAEIVKQEKAKQELAIASEIQMNFLPDLSGQAFGLDITARTLPARTVGGDFYDVLNLDPNKVGVLIADVSGKGVPAALFMVNAISQFRFLAPRYPAPADLLTHLNQILARDSTRGMFITAVYLVVDKKTRKVTYASAGHHAILRRRADGTAEELSSDGGPPVGLMPDAAFPQNETALECSDVLFLYTDGIVEARNPKGQEYGAALLKACLRPACPDAKTYTENIYNDIAAFAKGAPQHDDMTALVIRFANG